MSKRYARDPAGSIPLWRGFVLWLTQGCPRDMPVVIEAGRAIVVSDGEMTLLGWTLTECFMRAPLDLSTGSADADRLWEYLVSKKFATVEWMGVDQWQRIRQQTS